MEYLTVAVVGEVMVTEETVAVANLANGEAACASISFVYCWPFSSSPILSWRGQRAVEELDPVRGDGRFFA